MPSTPPIASIEWLETPTLRKWFARWLIAQWDYLYGGLGNPLMGQAYRAMATRMKRLAPSLPWMTTREQIKAVNTAAKQHGSATIRNRVLEVLRSHLERYGNRPENQEALKASAWCNVFALRQHQLEERGEMLVGKHYSWGKELELCLALQKLLGIFSALEIWPSAATPTRERREQRALFRAIRIALGAPSSNDQKPKREALTPRELAARLVHLFRDVWPRHPQPVILLGLNSDFDPRQLAPPSDLALVSRHRGKLSKTDRALRTIFRAIVLRENLRAPLLRLANDAIHRKKGWPHLQNALTAVFAHIVRTRPDEEQFRNFERSHYPTFRDTTKQQREVWIPELARGQDSLRRPLTKKERMILAASCLKVNSARDGSGQSSAETLYGRAKKRVEREIGIR